MIFAKDDSPANVARERVVVVNGERLALEPVAVFESINCNGVLAEHQHATRIALKNRSVEDRVGLRGELRRVHGERESARCFDGRIGRARRGKWQRGRRSPSTHEPQHW